MTMWLKWHFVVEIHISRGKYFRNKMVLLCVCSYKLVKISRKLFIGQRKVGYGSVNNDRSIRRYTNVGHSKRNDSGMNVMVLHAKVACRVATGLIAVRSLCVDSIILKVYSPLRDSDSYVKYSCFGDRDSNILCYTFSIRDRTQKLPIVTVHYLDMTFNNPIMTEIMLVSLKHEDTNH